MGDEVLGDPEAIQAAAGDHGARTKADVRLAQVEYVGAFADGRGLYVILDGVEAAHELMQISGPELLDNGHVEAHAIVSVEQMGEIFDELAQQGR